MCNNNEIRLGEWQVNHPEYIAGVLQSIPTKYDCIKYHKQQHTVDKYKGKGSCFPTVLACLLKLELHEVPHFNLLYFNSEEFKLAEKVYDEMYRDNASRRENVMDRFYYLSDEILITFLASKGYLVADIDSEWHLKNKYKPYMVYGKSPRGVSHVVIYMNGEMIHDPHPSNGGLVSIDRYRILKKVE